MNVRIGTRGSKLALAQTNTVLGLLANAGVPAESQIITTSGDAVLDRGLHQIGGQGVFVRELDNAILRGEIDAAVHSMKDIPAERPDGLITAAILPRDPPFDFFVFNRPVEEIYSVGTSSTRRRAQLLRYYQCMPQVRVEPLRGNVDTRLAKLNDGLYDAIVLAEAGLVRLGYHVNGVRLPVDQFVPSPNQGTVAVVCRDTPELREVFAPLNDAQTAFDTGVERLVMEQVGGGCFTPQGIFCRDGHLIAEVLSLDGSRSDRIVEKVTSFEEATEIGIQFREIASELIEEARTVLGLKS
ncbi:hydroxymethylbilane synthase [Methanocorpusculum sp. MG]|uniref:Probable porphobilinogen deaminase n=1 Tax=Methanocorpusculum petauri TaxID=3002863 RepID=A0ABT4IJT4_9EURY|nr:hydroxymethylbilane synthase [Methanocorpusculum petauri]MCZ0861522.1 hydroxymethylbilane synthase [Methanocorpusculum petauri]